MSAQKIAGTVIWEPELVHAGELTDNRTMGQARVAAEDNFALLSPVLAGVAQPSADEIRNLARAAGKLARGTSGVAPWTTMWDMRSLRSDGDRRYEAAGGILSIALQELHHSPQAQPILVRPGQTAALRSRMGWWDEVPRRSPIVEMAPKPLPNRPLELRAFQEDELDPYDVFDELPNNVQSYLDAAIALGLTPEDETWAAGGGASSVPAKPPGPGLSSQPVLPPELFEPLADMWVDAIEAKRVDAIRQALSSIATNSLLVQTLVSADESGAIHVVPYHSYSLHGVTTLDSDQVLMRPGRTSARYWSRFRSEILALERLLNTPGVKEREIEQLLISNPLFLHGLNYGNIYSQVVLPRGGEPDLRPDLIAEPIGDRWADIIDFKLPIDDILVGTDSRARLAAALNEAAAQLREYRAYFDDRALAKRIEDNLGIRCYQPKMVVIVGRDPRRYTPEQQRRAMTSYQDLEIVTYDHLLRAARSRLLV